MKKLWRKDNNVSYYEATLWVNIVYISFILSAMNLKAHILTGPCTETHWCSQCRGTRNCWGGIMEETPNCVSVQQVRHAKEVILFNAESFQYFKKNQIHFINIYLCIFYAKKKDVFELNMYNWNWALYFIFSI